MLSLVTAVMIHASVSESIYKEANLYRVKVKVEKEVANSLMSFSLLKIIHPF